MLGEGKADRGEAPVYLGLTGLGFSGDSPGMAAESRARLQAQSASSGFAPAKRWTRPGVRWWGRRNRLGLACSCSSDTVGFT